MVRRSCFALLALGIWAAAAVPIWAAAAAASPGADQSDLRFVLILSRHGVRSPLAKSDEADPYVVDPWPRWEVPPGNLTPHGWKDMELMGEYYREDYVAAGFLSGDAAADASRIFIRADSDQRTIASAKALAAGLAPGASVRIAALAEGRRDDPLFHPVQARVGTPDTDLAVASVLGRVGGDLAGVTGAYREDFDLLERILVGGDGRPAPGTRSIFASAPSIEPGHDYDLLHFVGPLRQTRLVDSLLLEYVDGKPMAEVGWGRATAADIGRLTALTALSFELGHRTLYPAQVEGSNVASHILATLEQAAQRRAVDGAIGSPTDRMVLLVGHDTNIVNFTALLDCHWQTPGVAPDFAMPGGALVFELRQSRADGHYSVRLSYVAQTLEQLRDASALSLARPPTVAPIFIPGAGTAGPGFDAPLDRFAARLREAINPAFTTPEPTDQLRWH